MKKILLTLIFSLIFITSTSYAFGQVPEYNFSNFEDPLVILETTQGEIVIEFFFIDAQIHSENFVVLSKNRIL